VACNTYIVLSIGNIVCGVILFLFRCYYNRYVRTNNKYVYFYWWNNDLLWLVTHTLYSALVIHFAGLYCSYLGVTTCRYIRTINVELCTPDGMVAWPARLSQVTVMSLDRRTTMVTRLTNRLMLHIAYTCWNIISGRSSSETLKLSKH